MNFKNELSRIFTKYPFLHMDKTGELSIIVPITGARRIIDNFSAQQTNPVSLYLFGDNTCKSDIERIHFFYNKKGNTTALFYDTQFESLLKDLKSLKNHPDSTEEDQKFIQTIITNLIEQNKKATAFKRGNPGYQKMKNHLEYGNEVLVSKGEFVVMVWPDKARSFQLPNVMNLDNPHEVLDHTLIAKTTVKQCFEALALIKAPLRKDKTKLLSDAVKLAVPDPRDYLLRRDGKDPKALFKAIYQSMHARNQSLPEQNPAVFENMESNLKLLYGDDEDYSTWTNEEILDAVKLLFKQAGVISEQIEVEKTFSGIFLSALNEYNEQHQDPKNPKTFTYQLFILQTFLYLCAMQLRLNNKEKAQHFIRIFKNTDELNNLVLKLCTDETAFKNMMLDEYELSSTEYQAIVASTYEISMDHVDTEHFDELRIACSSQSLHDVNYLIMGGALCWSTTPITESGNLNSPEQRKVASEEHFEIFYEQKQKYIQRTEAFQLIKQLFNAELSDEVRQQITLNSVHLSKSQKSELMAIALDNNKSPLVGLLLENSKNELFTDEFISLINKKPVDINLMNQFLNANSQYAHYFNGVDLINAVKSTQPNHVKLILKHRPDLLEYKDVFQQTPFLWACAKGNADLVTYLMNEGADIHARTIITSDYEYREGADIVGGRTARQWAQAGIDPDKTPVIISLFDHYYEQMENNFQSNPAYKDKFTRKHLSQAINNGDLKLIDLFLTYCPDLQKQFTHADLVRARKQHAQQELRGQIIPYQKQYNSLLIELQLMIGEIKGKRSYTKACETMQVLNNQLTKARNIFFMNEITPESFKKFENDCKTAVEKARPALATHRGWHNFPRFVRALLGILAGITVLPGLAFALISKNGYIGTFFSKKEDIKTNSIVKLEQFEGNLERLNTEISPKIKT